jgi:predicted Rossmann fold flavoprotein
VKYDVVIIGGGAAGLFCAITAGRRGRRVLVIEHNAEVGRKIIISGGGRCNFTNTGTGPENFISENPHFCRSALARFTPADFVELVRRHRIRFYEKKLGQLFCRESSRQIVEMLLRECRAACAEVRTNCRVESVAKDADFDLITSGGRISARSLVIASGGLSFPKIGASDFGYRIAAQFGIARTETRPSLVALVLEGVAYPGLAGISADAVVSTANASFRENILFTHRGLSGPAVLQISNYWQPSVPINVDLLPEDDAIELLTTHGSARRSVANALAVHLPKKLADALLPKHLSQKRAGELSKKEIEAVSDAVHSHRFRFRETEGYGRAEVTLGGVSTRELSSQTMEALKVPGLYFIGEVVDVTGWLGGYNFQWAWSSAFAAGNSV